MDSTEAIASVREISTTDEDPDYDDAAILRLLNKSLVERFTEAMITARSGYWRQKALIPITAGQPNYRVPRRAVNGIVEMVEIQDSTGGTFRMLAPMTPGRVYRYQGQGTPRAYAIDGDSINLRPEPTSAGATLRVTYFLSPSTLVAPESITAGYVQAVDVSGLGVTITTIPALRVDPGPPIVSVAGDLVNGTPVDIVRPDGTFELSLVAVPVTLVDPVSAYNITFPVGTDLSRVQVGDRMRQAGYSEWPMLPLGLHQALCDYTAAIVLLNKGDVEKAKLFAGKSDSAIDRVVDVVVPRAKAQPPTLTPRFSFLRSSRGWR